MLRAAMSEATRLEHWDEYEREARESLEQWAEKWAEIARSR